MPYIDNSTFLREELDDLQDSLNKVSNLVKLLSEEEQDRREIAEFLLTMANMKRQLAAIYKDYEQAVVGDFSNPLTLSDGTEFETSWSTSRKQWRHAPLMKAVAERIVEESFDFDTGEMSRSFEEMVRELQKYAGIAYWKKPVEDLGLDLDDYSVSETKPTVSIRRPK